MTYILDGFAFDGEATSLVREYRIGKHPIANSDVTYYQNTGREINNIEITTTLGTSEKDILLSNFNTIGDKTFSDSVTGLMSIQVIFSLFETSEVVPGLWRIRMVFIPRVIY